MDSATKRRYVKLSPYQWDQLCCSYLDDHEKTFISVKHWLEKYNCENGTVILANSFILQLRKPKYINRYLNMEARK
jgi:hypothetical protein